MFLKLSIFGLAFIAVGIIVWQYYPLWAGKVSRYESRKVKESAKRLNNMFLWIPRKKILFFHLLTPLALGGIGFLITREMFVALIAVAFGLALPTLILKRWDVNRRNKFQAQLVDGLMILSSSLKGGLSLLQSIESVVEEMPAPISQEFALVLRQNRVGIPLDECLENLNRRMHSDELNLIVTAIFVAHETGGDLPRIFTQLTNSIKEKGKILDKVKTLTVQAKLQGAIMCLLPVGFAVLIYTLNPNFFDNMLQSQIGRALLGYALVSQIIGIFLIMKLSKIEV